MYAEQSYTITDASDATYPFTFDWVRASHIAATINGTAVPSGDFAVSGSSGAAVLTLSGTTLSNLNVNDALRIYKTTPKTFALRTVDFDNEGTVTLASLDDAFKHDISLIQELLDDLGLCIQYDPDLGAYDAVDRQIRGLATGTHQDSAVTLAQLQAVETQNGALPAVNSAFNGWSLAVSGGVWTTVSPTTVAAAFGWGTAAYADTGVAATDDLPTRADADARYLQITNDLSDLTSAATARTNLGLGSAATLTAGSAAGNVLLIDGSGNIPAGVGLDPSINLSGTSVYQKGGGHYDVLAMVEFEEGATIAVDNDGVVVSDDFETDSANNVPLVDAGSNTPSYNWRNTGPVEVAVNATTDIFTLGVGTWEVDLTLMAWNDSGGQQRFGYALYNTTSSSLVKKVNNTFTYLCGLEGGVNQVNTFNMKAIIVVTTVAKSFAVRAATATGGGGKVIGGAITCRRLA